MGRWRGKNEKNVRDKYKDFNERLKKRTTVSNLQIEMDRMARDKVRRAEGMVSLMRAIF